MLSIKIVIVGPTGAGKTQIYNALLNSEFATTYTPTKGIDYDFVQTNDPPAEFQIYDKSGAESDSRSCKIFYRNTAVVLLVIDLTPERYDKKNLDDALREISQYNKGQLQLLLVGNKIDEIEDLRPEELLLIPLQYLQKSLPSNISLAYSGCASAKTGVGIKELVEALRIIASERLTQESVVQSLEEILADGYEAVPNSIPPTTESKQFRQYMSAYKIPKEYYDLTKGKNLIENLKALFKDYRGNYFFSNLIRFHWRHHKGKAVEVKDFLTQEIPPAPAEILKFLEDIQSHYVYIKDYDLNGSFNRRLIFAIYLVREAQKKPEHSADASDLNQFDFKFDCTIS